MQLREDNVELVREIYEKLGLRLNTQSEDDVNDAIGMLLRWLLRNYRIVGWTQVLDTRTNEVARKIEEVKELIDSVVGEYVARIEQAKTQVLETVNSVRASLLGMERDVDSIVESIKASISPQIYIGCKHLLPSILNSYTYLTQSPYVKKAIGAKHHGDLLNVVSFAKAICTAQEQEGTSGS